MVNSQENITYKTCIQLTTQPNNTKSEILEKGNFTVIVGDFNTPVIYLSKQET